MSKCPHCGLTLVTVVGTPPHMTHHCNPTLLVAELARLREANERLEKELWDREDGIHDLTRDNEELRKALEFYADPETYFAIGFFPDRPCGEFVKDFDDQGPELGHKPGVRARAALTRGGK